MEKLTPTAITAVLLILSLAFQTFARESTTTVKVDMHAVNQQGIQTAIGHIRISEHSSGLVIKPELRGLMRGLHGFHVHEHPNCGTDSSDAGKVPAGKAGGHLTITNNSTHGAPWSEASHMGDLPPLYFDHQQTASQPVFKPGLKLNHIVGHALVIHEGGDNYSNQPAALGGGGVRKACGVIAP